MAALCCGLLFDGCATPNGSLPRRNGEIINRYFEEWANQGNPRTADELIATNLVLRHPHLTVNGLEAYKKSMASFHSAFPDLHYAIEDQVAQRDRVLARWTLTGTQRGDYQGHPASGRKINVSGMSLFRIRRGMIEEIWVNMDRLGFQEQLGWLSTPSAAASSAGDHRLELRSYDVTTNKLTPTDFSALQ